MASSSEIEIEVENQPSPATPHASSASSSAAADPTTSSRNVFINHRGPDTKKTFASHLYHRLLLHGFTAFLDLEELQEGFHFPSQIEHAIRSASVHVAVFSPKYADSEWCLRELLLMLESRAPIIPVFYHVQPADLRWTGGVYAEALHRLQMKTNHCSQTHQDKPRYDPATIQKWRDALSSVADISGFDLDGKFNGDEGEMLDKLVERVQKMAKKKRALDVAQHPTGLDQKIKDFETTVLLNNQSTGKVQMVGIVGLGGMGKTTLAKRFFNIKRSEYNKCCFLPDVRNSKSSLHSLQSKLLKDLNLLLNGPIIDNIHEGKEMLRKSLSSSQVFVVLDDIDHEDQVVALLPDRDGLSNDSLILITSRDKYVLARSGVEESSIYELKGLDSKHSRELFCSYAFCHPYPLGEFEDLVEEFLRACDGLPLSLKVFGALLFCQKEKSQWKDILHRVHEVPNDIVDRLKISYDALSGEERQIFLDIACFFIGKNKNSAIKLWKGSLGFRNLQGKCLVEVDSENVIHMHDHLRDMGREIAKDESPRRLLHPTENIDDWLQQQSSVISEARGISMDGNNEVANVLIRSPMPSWSQRKIDKVFGNRMKKRPGISAMKLQLLSSEGHLLERILRRVHSPNLIWLSWSDCPYSYLPSWIPMKNLRVLRLQRAVLNTLWQGQSQAPLQLQELEIIGAVLLNIPKSMGQLKHLERIIISFSSLPKLPEEFCHLKSLRLLVLKFCPTESLPDSFGNLASLQHMELSNCDKLERLPDSFGNLASLQHMKLSQCYKLERLPDSFGNLASLQHMDLSGCKKLDWLPDSFGNMASLQHMDLSFSKKLERLPDSFGNMASLQHMNLSGCKKLERLPDSFGNLASLQHMDLSGCKKLQRLPDSFGNLASLQHMDLSGCKKLERLPDSFGNLASLQHMKLFECYKFERLPDSFGNLASLQHMELSRSWKLERLPDSFGNLASLQHMKLSSLYKLERLPDSFGCLSSLKSFKLNGCSNLTISSDTLGNIRKLEHIDLSGCGKIEVWPSQLALQRSLKTLELRGTNFKELPRAVEVPRGLEVLQIGSPLVDTLSLDDLRKLKELTLKDGRELKHLPASVGLSTELISLEVVGCPAMELPFKMVKAQRETVGTLMKSDSSINHNYMFGLQHLKLVKDTEISELSFDEGVCPNLRELILKKCSNLAEVGTLPSRLHTLHIEECEELQELRTIVCPNLRVLSLKECSNLAEVGTLPSTLHSLHIEKCEELQELRTIGIKSLEHLFVIECVKLKSIRDLAQLTNPVELVVAWCAELEELEGIEYCKSLRITRCPKLQGSS